MSWKSVHNFVSYCASKYTTGIFKNYLCQHSNGISTSKASALRLHSFKKFSVTVARKKNTASHRLYRPSKLARDTNSARSIRCRLLLQTSSVCVMGELCTNRWFDRDAVWGEGQRNHVLDWNAHWRHLANAKQWSVCGGDAVHRCCYCSNLFCCAQCRCFCSVVLQVLKMSL